MHFFSKTNENEKLDAQEIFKSREMLCGERINNGV